MRLIFKNFIEKFVVTRYNEQELKQGLSYKVSTCNTDRHCATASAFSFSGLIFVFEWFLTTGGTAQQDPQ